MKETMKKLPYRFARRLLACALALGWVAERAAAQDFSFPAGLPRDRFTSGEETLHAFAPVSAATRYSIVEVNVDGDAVALGAVVDGNGLALTKASELKQGKLTCWLANGKEVPARLLAADEEDDVALLRVEAKGLKPIQWSDEDVEVGQWAITPGLDATPQAVGIISALPRRIRPVRAFIGVQFDFNTSLPKVEALLPGLGAEKAGLKPGDIIAAVNDRAVTNREQIVEALGDFGDGQTVKLRVRRGDKQFDTEVKMTSPTTGPLSFSSYARQQNNRMAGEVSRRARGFEQAIEHDTVLQPWLCGGPLVNLDGKAVGLNIARASRVATYALPARLVRRILDTLKSAPRAGAGAGE